MKENVLCICRSAAEDFVLLDSGVDDDATTVSDVLSNDQCFFVPRDRAENNHHLLQIIPYTICFQEGTDRILCYQRSGGEQRLDEKWSIGIGGHVNDKDLGSTDDTEIAFAHALARELHEEIGWQPTAIPNPYGFISLDDSEVSRVHLGILHVVRLAEDFVISPEANLKNVEWLPMNELSAFPSQRYESWSGVLVMDYLDLLLAHLEHEEGN